MQNLLEPKNTTSFKLNFFSCGQLSQKHIKDNLKQIKESFMVVFLLNQENLHKVINMT